MDGWFKISIDNFPGLEIQTFTNYVAMTVFGRLLRRVLNSFYRRSFRSILPYGTKSPLYRSYALSVGENTFEVVQPTNFGYFVHRLPLRLHKTDDENHLILDQQEPFVTHIPEICLVQRQRTAKTIKLPISKVRPTVLYNDYECICSVTTITSQMTTSITVRGVVSQKPTCTSSLCPSTWQSTERMDRPVHSCDSSGSSFKSLETSIITIPLLPSDGSQSSQSVWDASSVETIREDDERSSLREGARTYPLLANDVWGQAHCMNVGLIPSNEAYLLSNDSELAEAAVLIDDDYFTDFEELGPVRPCIDYPEDYEPENASPGFRPSGSEVAIRLTPDASLNSIHLSSPTIPSSTQISPVPDITGDICVDFDEIGSASGVQLAQAITEASGDRRTSTPVWSESAKSRPRPRPKSKRRGKGLRRMLRRLLCCCTIADEVADSND